METIDDLYLAVDKLGVVVNPNLDRRVHRLLSLWATRHGQKWENVVAQRVATGNKVGALYNYFEKLNPDEGPAELYKMVKKEQFESARLVVPSTVLTPFGEQTTILSGRSTAPSGMGPINVDALSPVLRRMYNRGVLFDLNNLGNFKDATVVIVGSFAVCVGMGQVVHGKAGEDGTGGRVPSQAMNIEIAMAADLSKNGERVICIDAFQMSLPADALDKGLPSNVAADMAENMNAVMIYGPMRVLGLGSWVNKASDLAANSVFGNGTIVQMETRTTAYKVAKRSSA